MLTRHSKLINKSLKPLQIFIIILTFTQTSLGNTSQNSKLSNLKDRYFTFGIHYKEKSLFDDNSHNYFSIGYNFCNKHAFRLNFNYRLIYKETNDVEYFDPEEALGNGEPCLLNKRFQTYIKFDYLYKVNITKYYTILTALGPYLKYYVKSKETRIRAIHNKTSYYGGTVNSISYIDHGREYGLMFTFEGQLKLIRKVYIIIGLEYMVAISHDKHRNKSPTRNSRHFDQIINDWNGLNIGLSYRL